MKSSQTDISFKVPNTLKSSIMFLVILPCYVIYSLHIAASSFWHPMCDSVGRLIKKASQ